MNWVRDRQDADVHLLITAEGTGGGGRAYTLKYIGLREYQQLTDELTFATRRSDTGDEVRSQLTQRIGLGLVRYVARGPIADKLRLAYAGGTTAAEAPGKDPWNSWVFSLSASGSLNGESQTKRDRISGSLGISRVTEDWKFSLSAGGARNHSSYQLSDSSTFTSTLSAYSGGLDLVRSLGGHWSWDLQSSGRRSTWENYNLLVESTTGLEFDVFPYTDYSRRQLLFVYSVGMTYANYNDTTIFNKLKETRPTQQFLVAAQATQPWGSLSSQIRLSSFLDDFTQNRITVNGGLSLRIARGLNFDISGGYSRVRDQLSLLKQGLSDEEILLQLKQLRTSFYYYGQVGLSYSFGSKLNNVVNPRFSK